MIAPQEQFEGLNITFNTGESCNLACTYCYETCKKPTILDFDIARRFIDLLLEDPDPVLVKGTDLEWLLKKGIVLDFIGGDALMVPDLVDSILDYWVYKTRLTGSHWKDNWRASISTNGTLFENDKVQRLIVKWHKNLSVGVSIDGCPEIHDKNRVFKDGSGTIQVIQKTWHWYRSLYPNAETKSTLNRNSIPYLYKSLKFLHEELQLNYINMNFIFEDMGLQESDLKMLDEQMALCTDYVLEHRKDLYWSMIDKRFFESMPYSWKCQKDPNTSWCGSGSMPALAPNGKIYPCFRFLPASQPLGVDLSVGDVWTGFSRKENFLFIRGLCREEISPEKCKQCNIESSCAWCIAGSFAEKGYPYRQTYICEPQKLIDKWAKIYWKRYNEKYDSH